MVRTFVAIDLPEDIRERARESQEILKRSSGRLAIVDPANLHLTVKFLGEIDPAQVDPVVEALRAVRAAPFSLTVGYPVCNPPRKPRVIWCDVTDGGESAALARQVDDLLAPLGFSRETRPFRPHVTLARVKDFHPSQCREAASIPREPLGTCRVASIKLKKSTLTPRGSIYEDLAEVAL
ncbi:2'-5'-RNA ligase [Methanoculleus chikugoensis]|jgi:2'-5' RNA ligase|uniref:RNA 2',3'-cyclic phosphodiesterase n=1 Tax=Methanoculleus chikugoensis TaxID=118126 RepID=A0A1M4MKF0_9EURY|nr:RNA 2',3'-cyclic phosphodiesterase [Methanoculleus chikugoensis]MDD4567192.1 RNA 2',3'-cyclic phosphodiesterase [Methanoculleus chikugoensis]NMA09622.1 RNA 2',3'-cyclic phosphodiesterase [Methanomicrobiales archaeon]SCL75394.1 2'-5'-RNA ligase [Methanoculleus chikugoensis]